MYNLKIAGTPIRRDAEGRYSLVDLYRASGSNPKNKPSEWLRNRQTKELIEELNKEGNKAGIPAYSTSQKSGTFVVRPLVYAYAMWISPAFNLRVIRAFDAIVNSEFVQPSLQAEAYWFGKRPYWSEIRNRVMRGYTFRMIALETGRSTASVRNAVRRMIEVGILQPLRAASAAISITGRRAILRYHRKHSISRQMMLPGFAPATIAEA